MQIVEEAILALTTIIVEEEKTIEKIIDEEEEEVATTINVNTAEENRYKLSPPLSGNERSLAHQLRYARLSFCEVGSGFEPLYELLQSSA